MIVRLTHSQGRAVAHRVSNLHRTAMLEHRTKAGRTQHDYDLPAIAWRQILDELTSTCYGPVGGKLHDVPGSVFAAIKRIASAVMAIENHPGLRGARVEGWVGDLLIAWGDPIGVRRGASPYPFSVAGVYGVRFLLPRHEELHGLRVTRWTSERGIVSGVDLPWSLTVEANMAFVDRSASPDAESLSDEFDVEPLIIGQPFTAAD